MFVRDRQTMVKSISPSKWGFDDEIGSANLVMPERVRAAAALVREGRSQPLGIVIDRDTPAFAPRSLSLLVRLQGPLRFSEKFQGQAGAGSRSWPILS